MGRRAWTHAGADGTEVALGAMVGTGGGLVGVGTSVGALVDVGAVTCVGEAAVVGVVCGDGDGDGDGRVVGVGVDAASARDGSPSAARPSTPEPSLRCRKKSRRSIRSGSRVQNGCRERRRTSLTGTRRAREKSAKRNTPRRNFVLVNRMNGDPRVSQGDRAADWGVTSTHVASLVRLSARTASPGRLARRDSDVEF
jgi:hypothetical protein